MSRPRGMPATLHRWLRRFPRGLPLRLAVPFVVLIAVVLLVLGAYLGVRARDIYVDRLSDELIDQAAVIGYSIDRADDQGADTATLQGMVSDIAARTTSRVTLIAADGSVIADSEADPATMDNHASRPEVIDANTSGQGISERSSDTVELEYLYVATRVEGSSGTIVRLAVPLDSVDDTVDRMQRIIAIAALLSIVLTSAVALVISARIVRPLQDLRRQATSVARGDLGARVEPATTSEIGDVGRAFNIMTRRLAESRSALEHTRIRMEAILAGLNDGVVLTDADGLVLRINEAAQQMFSVTERDAIGQPFVQICRDHEIDSLLRSALAGEDQLLAAIEHGLNRRTLMTTAQLISEDTERLGLVVLRDVSELRRLETVRREFVANVSHELRTPLTSIRALVETLETGAVDDPRMEAEFLGRIIGETDRLTALVEDLLDLARLEAGRSPLRRTRIAPDVLVRQGADRLLPQIERARLNLEIVTAEDMPDVEVDVSRIEQVLLNLVHNAIKFTPPEGTITVEASATPTDIVVEVRDTGIGIPPDEQGRLFERFYKSDKARRSEGTGLGLAIAKHIVQAHGGDISVTSNVGSGSTFRFTLPLQPAEPPRSWRLPNA
jgi:two-component system phosphate regulon sensor histidine kinase PhoR